MSKLTRNALRLGMVAAFAAWSGPAAAATLFSNLPSVPPSPPHAPTSIDSNSRIAQKFIPMANGTNVTSMTVNCQSVTTSGTFVLELRADASGVPGALMASGSANCNVGAANITVPMSAGAAINTVTTYWAVFYMNGGAWTSWGNVDNAGGGNHLFSSNGGASWANWGGSFWNILTLQVDGTVGPPTIFTQPTNQTIFTGQTLNLTVVATGSLLTYQWFQGVTPISGATGATYTKLNAQASDAGTYHATATNAAGTATTNNVTVTVNGPPQITTSPGNQTLFAGQTLTLAVAATGVGLSYQWRIGNAAISGATSATYTKTAVTGDSGNYDVVVTNGAGNATSSPVAVVLVNGPPNIGTQPVGQVLFVGQTINLSVVATGASLSYQWRRNTTPISGATAASYSKINAVVGDSGTYDVVVSNGAGSVTSNGVTVEVSGPPSITSQPTSQSLFAGQTLTLTVAATGVGMSYQWRKAGNPIALATNPTYTKTAVAGDVGNYDVVITNTAGMATSNSVSVTINGAPTITTPPTGQALFTGQTISLAVVASGAQLSYQWRRNGSPVVGGGAAAFSKANAGLGDAGSYDVVISNPAGSVTTTAVAVTIAAGPRIDVSPSDQLIFIGGTISLSVSATGSALTYQWRKNTNPIGGATAASYTKTAVAGDGGSYDVVVTNGGGSVTSAAAIVTVSGPPQITSTLSDLTVFSGQTISLSIAASGAGLGYQWRQSGNPIAGATAPSYTRVATVGDAGSYDVVVTNGAGTATSNAAVVAVLGPPVINTSPADQNLFAAQTISLSVDASGASLSYRWRKDGSPLPGATFSMYAKPGALVADSGSYDVVVSNPAGSVTSAVAVVTVNGPPVITAQPDGETVFLGEPIALDVAAAGGGLSYQWRLGGTPIAGATGSSYAVAASTLADAGSYDVVVTNSAGSVTSTAAVVAVSSQPVITQQPADVTVFATQPVVLTVAASGATGYQWQHDGTPISGATGTSYILASALGSDAGSYTVVVSNPAGSVTSNPAVVVVNGTAAITTQPVGQTVFATQPIMLSVTATGVGLTYQWRRDGAPIAGATGTSFTTVATVSDQGVYDVVVTNAAGSVTSQGATVTVNGPPVIGTQPGDQDLVTGDALNLSVTATGVGLSYQWRKDGSPIAGATGTSFMIASVGSGDTGSYDVVVTNLAGTATSNGALVSINGLPVISAQPADVGVFVTQPATLTVEASGSGLTYQWRKGGVAIAGATDATFSIAHVAVGDAGSYDVVVSNSAGMTTSNAAIITVNGPPAITTQPADQTLNEGATIQLAVVASGAGLVYRWQHNGVDLVGGAAATFRRTGATLADAGTYQVIVSNLAGSVTSNGVEVTVRRASADAGIGDGGGGADGDVEDGGSVDDGGSADDGGSDGSISADASVSQDGSAGADSGTKKSAGGGCGCRTGEGQSSGGVPLALLGLGVVLVLRRRRR